MLGIVTGLKAEARLARPLGLAVAGGGQAAGARRAAEQLADQGVTGLISFGLAGGLDPNLRAGALVIPTRVLTMHGICDTDAALVAALGGPTADVVLATDKIVALAADKRRLWEASGAAALDMESGEVAQVARQCGLGFAVLRAVCDPVCRDLPPAALAALDSAGGIGLARVIFSVLRRPSQLPDLLRLAGDARQARDSLRRQVGSLEAARM